MYEKTYPSSSISCILSVSGRVLLVTDTMIGCIRSTMITCVRPRVSGGFISVSSRLAPRRQSAATSCWQMRGSTAVNPHRPASTKAADHADTTTSLASAEASLSLPTGPSRLGAGAHELSAAEPASTAGKSIQLSVGVTGLYGS